MIDHPQIIGIVQDTAIGIDGRKYMHPKGDMTL
jgi:hypothetical protein